MISSARAVTNAVQRDGRRERLVDGPGEVPGVDEELDAEDADRHRRRRRAVAERDLAVSATFAPRGECGLRRLRHVVLRRSSIDVVGNLGAGHRPERPHAAHQMFHEFVHGVVGARRRQLAMLGSEPLHHVAAQRPARLHRRQIVELVRARRPGIEARVARGSHVTEALQVVRPARTVADGLIGRQAVMGDPHERLVPRRFDVDHHGRRARRKIVGADPTPRVDDTATWFDLGERAARDVAGRDGQPVVAADPQIDGRTDRFPSAEPFGLGEQRERLVRRGIDGPFEDDGGELSCLIGHGGVPWSL